MSTTKYVPTDYAKSVKLRIVIEVGSPDPKTHKRKKAWVGIGGAIQMRPKPPKIPYTVREATSDEYKQVFDRGYTKYVQEIVEDNVVQEDPKQEPKEERVYKTEKTSKKKKNR